MDSNETLLSQSRQCLNYPPLPNCENNVVHFTKITTTSPTSSEFHSTLSSPSRFPLPKAPGRTNYSSLSPTESIQPTHVHGSYASCTNDVDSSFPSPLLAALYSYQPSKLNPPYSTNPSPFNSPPLSSTSSSSTLLHPPTIHSLALNEKSLLNQTLDLKSQLKEYTSKLKVLDKEKTELLAQHESMKSQLDTMESKAQTQAKEYEVLEKSYKHTCAELAQLQLNHQSILDQLDSFLLQQQCQLEGKEYHLNYSLGDLKTCSGSSFSNDIAKKRTVHDTKYKKETYFFTNIDQSKSSSHLSFQTQSDEDQRNESIDSKENKQNEEEKDPCEDRTLHAQLYVDSIPMKRNKTKKPTVRAISIQVNSLESFLPDELERLVHENVALQTLLEKYQSNAETLPPSHVPEMHPSLMHELDLAKKVHCAIQTSSCMDLEENATSDSNSHTIALDRSNSVLENPSMSPSLHPPFSPSSTRRNSTASNLERRMLKLKHFSFLSETLPPPSLLSTQLQDPLPSPVASLPLLTEAILSLKGAYFKKLNRYKSRPQPRYCWVHKAVFFWSPCPPFDADSLTVNRIRALSIKGIDEAKTKYGTALVILSHQRDIYLITEDRELHINWKSKLNQIVTQSAV